MTQRSTVSAERLIVAVAIGLCTTFACAAATTGEPQPPDIHPLTTPDLAGTGMLGQTSSPQSHLAMGVSTALPGSSTDFPGAAPAAPPAAAASTPAHSTSPAAPAADGGSGDGGAPAPDSGPSDGGAPTPDSGPPDSGPPDSGPPDSGPPDGGPGDGGSRDGGAPPDAEAPVPLGPPPTVEMKTPKFENGDVPKAEKALSGTKLLDAIAKCVGDAGGLTGKTGSMKVELLVRGRGKAEGVEVTPQGASKEAARCVRELFKNRTIGTPSADPVGVTVVYSLKPSK